MGCGSSGQAVAPEAANGNLKSNGRTNGHGNDHHNDDLPTVVLPETPAKKPPSFRSAQAVATTISLLTSQAIAFEIPLEEFDGTKRGSTPPPHLQRLLQPPQAEISLPDIEEKLAEAEQRRQTILQQRAASAQKRSQKMMKSFSEMDQLDSEQDSMHMDTKSYKVDPMKMETSRMEQPFSKKKDPMTVNPVMSDTSKQDYMTSNTRDDPRQNVTGLKLDPVHLGQNDPMKKGSNKNDSGKRDSLDNSKYGTNAVRIPPEPGMCEDKNI